MAVVSRVSDMNMTTESLTGLKIEISPEILMPRDTGIDSKIFTLIPSHIRTVRELKNHLSTNVLRTPSPFYFYNGEYRIPDEEDVRIFSLLTEPCRILPVPRPKSALSSPTSPQAISSTPITLCNGISTPKRVKFSDQLSSSSATVLDQKMDCAGISLRMISPVNLEDQVDNNAGNMSFDGTENINFSSLTAFSPAPASALKSKKLEEKRLKVQEGEESTKEEKKKRRRRHKTKKRDKVASTEAMSSFERDESPTMKMKSSMNSDGQTGDGSPDLKKQKTLTQEYDADESELDPSQNGSKGQSQNGKSMDNLKSLTDAVASKCKVDETKNKGKKIFLSPNTAFSETGYVSLRSSYGNGTISSFDSSEYGSPAATSTRKRRQDTPNLPRVLKNPSSAYEMVKKSLNARLNQAAEHSKELFEFEEGHEEVADLGKVNGDGKGESQRNEEFYKNLAEIKGVAEIEVGHVLAFKVLELDENYVPSVSTYKEARVTAKDGILLTFEYIKNDVKERSGVFEIADIETEPLDQVLQKNFGELIEPKQLQI